MAKADIYIFTSSYPYSIGREDTFLKPELNILADMYQITVIPLNVGGGVHDVPSGVLVNDSFGRRNNLSVKNALINAIPLFLTKFLWMEIVRNYKKLSSLLAFKDLLINALKRKAIFDWLSANQCLLNNNCIFYSYWFDGYTSGLLDYKFEVGNKEKIKVISRAHRGDLYVEETRAGYIPFREEALEQIDAVFLISKHGQKYLANEYPEFARKLMHSPLGIDDNKIYVKGSTDGVVRIVSCSFVSAVKRVDKIFMSIFELSKLTDEYIEWFHIGGGIDLNKIKNLTRINIRSNLKVNLLGNLENSKIFEFYKNQPLDLFLMLSESEGKPVAMMEAMSVGLPVITTDVGGISELIENGVNGSLLEVDVSVGDVAQSIFSIINSKKRLECMKFAVRNKWLETCHSEICYRSFSDLLHKLTRN